MADLKQIARLIFHETLAAIDIPVTMQRKLPLEGSILHCGEIAVDLRSYSKIRAVAIGKAAHAMLAGLRALLPPNVGFEGIAVRANAAERSAAWRAVFCRRPSDPECRQLGGR